MPPLLKTLPDGVTALLIETRAPSATELQARIASVLEELHTYPLIEAPAFTTDPAEIERLWNVRKGTFPAVGAVRKPGTTVIIEDVAVAVPLLAAACLDLQRLFARHGYHEAIIFGHALEGNVHFVFTQDFGIESEVARYAAFMDELRQDFAEAVLRLVAFGHNPRARELYQQNGPGIQLARERLRALEHVLSVELSGGEIVCTCEASPHNLVDILDTLRAADVALGRVWSEPPTLNDVFLEITGRELRD